MKLSEYIEKFGDKQVDVDKLSEFIIEDKVFVPRKNEKYYFVNTIGKVSAYYNDRSIDKSIIDSRQVYRTEEEAEFARDKAIFLEFMRKEFLRNSDELDWSDDKQDKFYVAWNCFDRKTLIGCNWFIIRNDFYTTNLEWLKQYIRENEEDIKKYYFEVKE